MNGGEYRRGYCGASRLYPIAIDEAAVRFTHRRSECWLERVGDGH
jgi:hypothetical protein